MKKWFLLIVIMFSSLLVACSSSEDEDSSANQEKIEIEHELGKTELTKNPQKVVVFDFGVLDSLDELDVDVAGVAKQTMPPYLEQYSGDTYENIGSLKEPDFDTIANINPGLIIISDRQAEQYDELSKLGPTIHLGIDQSNYMDSFAENMEVLGQIFSKEKEVEEKLDAIDQQVEEAKKAATEKDNKGLIVLANDDKMSAYGPKSRFGFIHDVIGVQAADENIEVATHGMNISSEYIAEKNPDILYVIDRGAAIGEDSSVKDVVENKLVQRTNAYKEDKIVYLDPYNWYLSGGGLQSVPKMIEEIEKSLQ